VPASFKKDRQGQVVITKLDEVTLEKIALQTGGKYYRASSAEDELKKIYAEISEMEKKELGSRRYAQFEDRYQYVLGFALLWLTDRDEPFCRSANGSAANGACRFM
jgi:Ca-activated chloride channel family protein